MVDNKIIFNGVGQMNIKLFLMGLLIFLILCSLCFCSGCEEKQAKEMYVGSLYSNIYHNPSCECAQKINHLNEIWFLSDSEARTEGYRACKVCRP